MCTSYFIVVSYLLSQTKAETYFFNTSKYIIEFHNVVSPNTSILPEKKIMKFEKMSEIFCKNLLLLPGLESEGSKGPPLWASVLGKDPEKNLRSYLWQKQVY